MQKTFRNLGNLTMSERKTVVYDSVILDAFGNTSEDALIDALSPLPTNVLTLSANG